MTPTPKLLLLLPSYPHRLSSHAPSTLGIPAGKKKQAGSEAEKNE